MKKLDWYIIKRFLGTFFFMLVMIMAIAVVFDVAENIDRFIRDGIPAKDIILDYYVSFVLFYGNLFTSFIVFLSIIFVTSKMARDTEIVPILGGGVKYMRLLRPFMIGAAFLAVISFCMNHYLVPMANMRKQKFDQKWEGSGVRKLNEHKDVGDNKSVYFKSYYEGRGYIDEFYLTKRNPDNKRLEKIIYAQKAKGDSTSNNWRLTNYAEINFTKNPLKFNIKKNKVLDTTLSFDLKEFIKELDIVTAMTTPELMEFIADEEQKGAKDIPFYKVELHQRTSYPLATFILTLIGVSISSRKSRNGIGVNLVLGLVVCLLYIFSYRMATVGAINAGFSPFWAVWTPNIIFALVAYYIYRRAPK